jgi:hypothetical protein
MKRQKKHIQCIISTKTILSNGSTSKKDAATKTTLTEHLFPLLTYDPYDSIQYSAKKCTFNLIFQSERVAMHWIGSHFCFLHGVVFGVARCEMQDSRICLGALLHGST